MIYCNQTACVKPVNITQDSWTEARWTSRQQWDDTTRRHEVFIMKWWWPLEDTV